MVYLFLKCNIDKIFKFTDNLYDNQAIWLIQIDIKKIKFVIRNGWKKDLNK